MILASGEGQLIFLAIMAFVGVINWLSKKLSAGNKLAPRDPSESEALQPRRDHAESEEERMRRFLEALGLPADDRLPPARPRSESRPVVAPPPVPTAPRRPVRPAAAVPPLQPQQRTIPQTQRPVPSSRVEKIALPELAVPSVPEFETLSSQITAAPLDFPATRDEADRSRGPTLGETLRAALASPQQLRSAFILAEVFGPPPGLRHP